MKKRFLSMVLATVMALGLAVPSLATGPMFSDVPESHWAYESVMKMADAGVIKGVGGNRFAPKNTLTAEMFIVLVGRVLFPEVKAEGADWSGPYVAEAKAKGLLEGTNVTDSNLKGEISRYDMAVILSKCVDLLKVSASKADSSKVTDYGDIPNRYTDAVLMAYGSGLIKGDESNRFNGANSMTRQEAATVMDRLIALKPGGSGVTQPEKPEETEQPTTPTEDPIVEYEVHLFTESTTHSMAGRAYDKATDIPSVPVKLFYTPDRGETSILVAEGVTSAEAEGTITGKLPVKFQAPESWGENGLFYVSGETVYEGQRLVTSDLRTDGRAYKTLIGIRAKNHGFPSSRYTPVEMTPPNGEKIQLTFKGYVDVDTPAGEKHPEGFTVQLHFKDGTVLGEAVTDANGTFKMDFELDILDDVLDTQKNQYYTSAEGYVDGIHYHRTGIASNTGKLMLQSLYGLGICIPSGHGEWRTDEAIVGIDEYSIVSP